MIVLRTYSGTRGGLKGAAGENARSNSQSRKRRRSCPSLSLGVRGPPPSTDADVWRKCIVFCKNAFRDPEPNSSSRRRSRGAKGRFGPVVDRPWPMQRAAEDGSDPGAAETSRANRAPIGCLSQLSIKPNIVGASSRSNECYAPAASSFFAVLAYGQCKAWGPCRRSAWSPLEHRQVIPTLQSGGLLQGAIPREKSRETGFRI